MARRARPKKSRPLAREERAPEAAATETPAGGAPAAAARSGGGNRTLFLFLGGLAAVLGLVVLATATGGQQPPEPGDLTPEETDDVGTATSEPPGSAVTLRVEVHERYPHDPRAFTQGLLWHRGRLFESTGHYGRSTLREVTLGTGEVRRRLDLDRRVFAEGLERIGEQLVQLTWREHRALRYDLETFERVGEHEYEGEGWGLCFDGESLVMSDGTPRLTFRDPVTFEPERTVRVRLDGAPVRHLNELECANGEVWANVWETDRIVRIDPSDGRVTGVVDASGLLTPEESFRANVLNGIAYVPERERFLITGKDWPWIFEVTFEPRP